MSVKHPKPDFRGKDKPPYGPWMEWVERQLDGVLSTTYSTLAQAIQAAVAAIDLSAIESDIDDLEAEVADHETRIDTLEGASVASRVSVVMGRATTFANGSGVTSYAAIQGRNEGASITTTIADGQMLWPLAGKFTFMNAQNITSTGDADTFTLALNVGGSDSALICTGMAGNDTSVHEVTADVTVAKNDLVTISKVNSVGTGTLTNDVCWALIFVADP